MRRGLLLVAILLLAACSGSDDAAAPATTAAPAVTAAAVTPEGFETISVTIRDASDATRELCLWLAATPEARQQGLMQVTDLAGKDGMLFAFDLDTQEQFWMFQTVMPLSIAFFDSRGAFVSSTDMAPCTGTTCPTYSAAAQYRDAIEVPQGTLRDLGIGPGSALVGRGSCPA
jgi:uncharacterized membrane protein (UPF0127 family)